MLAWVCEHRLQVPIRIGSPCPRGVPQPEEEREELGYFRSPTSTESLGAPTADIDRLLGEIHSGR